VKRTLLLTVHRNAPAESIARLEVDLMAMPDHISSICYWTPSRTAGGVWTHAWEQEYRDVDGLLGVYLRHPFHWTSADRWFECEVPTSIVLLAVAHVYRWADGPVLP
jgi:Stress responsive A/B Barrel Domain